MITVRNKETMIKNIYDRLGDEAGLLYHIDNPFLERYLDIIIDCICEEIEHKITKEVPELIQEAFRKITRGF